MKLTEASITFLVNHQYASIEVHDETSATTILTIKLSPEQFTSALSRLSHTRCDVEVFNLNVINKKHENKNFEFEVPKEITYMNRDLDKVHAIAVEKCPEGWEPDNYYKSQSSFFSKDGKQFARTIIRRWI